MLKSAPGDARTVVAQFAGALDREEFRAALERLARHDLGWGSVHELHARPLKAHRRRCTFDLTVRTDSGWHAVIGKVHTGDRSDVFRTMAAIRGAGFGSDATYSIPQPLLYLPALHVLLEEKVPGPAAMTVLPDPYADQRDVVADRCGEWLARFHEAAPLPPAPPEHAGTVRARVPQWAERVAGAGAALAGRTAVLVRRLQLAAPPPEAVAPRAGHGSYMPEHVLLAESRTCVIDLDECDVADPGRDVAWFVVSLQRLALKQGGTLHGLDDVVERFVQAYTAAAPAGATDNLPFYRAAECLHRARRDVAKRIPPRPEWSEIMLEEGLRVLA